PRLGEEVNGVGQCAGSSGERTLLRKLWQGLLKLGEKVRRKCVGAQPRVDAHAEQISSVTSWQIGGCVGEKVSGCVAVLGRVVDHLAQKLLGQWVSAPHEAKAGKSDAGGEQRGLHGRDGLDQLLDPFRSPVTTQA